MERKRAMKNKLTIALSVMLVAVLAIGATLALMSADAGNITNEFKVYTGDKALAAELVEMIKGDDPQNPGTEIDIESKTNKSFDLYPGVTVRKGPKIKNTTDPAGTNASIYAAIKVEFKDNTSAKNVISNDPTQYSFSASNTAVPSSVDNDLAHLQALIDWDASIDTTGWADITPSTMDDGSKIFLFKTVVPAGGATGELFSNISLISAAKTEDAEWLGDSAGLNGFNIELTGAAVQYDLSLINGNNDPFDPTNQAYIDALAQILSMIG